MLIIVIRTVILYLLVVAAVRLMGKRQVGDLQPLELVVTILLSEIAATPMQNNNIPMLRGIVAVCILTVLELLFSVVSLKSVRFRNFTEGKPQVVVRDGKPVDKQLKKLRLTVEDILSALRQKSVFSLGDVKTAVVETNGTLSVLTRATKTPVNPADLMLPVDEKEMACPIMADGKATGIFYEECGFNDKKLKELLHERGLEPKNVYLLTVDASGNVALIERKETK